MAELRARFGQLVSVHRRRLKLTQAELAERVGVSVDMISKIEIGRTGARFPVLERLASALNVDVAELFAVLPTGALLSTPALQGLIASVAGLSDADLAWVNGIVQAALEKRKR